MTDERFHALVDGPLSHPLIPFRILRLIMALRFVVEVTGDAGAHALEAHCAGRQARDESDDGRGLWSDQ